MLCEPFLHVLTYTKENLEHTPVEHKKIPHRIYDSTRTHLSNGSPLSPQALRASCKKISERTGLTSLPSMALAIPTCSFEDHWGVEIYGSHYCPSIYQAYPDLQLAGGTLACQYPPHGTLLTPQPQGPLLNSEDLSILEELEKSEELGDSQVEVTTDEGYLVIENVKGLVIDQRLTNSMLNGFLETQLMEVYRQHMQDSLARCCSSSLTSSVVPEMCTNLTTSVMNEDAQGKGPQSGPVQGCVRYLSTCSAPSASHFSSPVLRISFLQESDTTT